MAEKAPRDCSDELPLFLRPDLRVIITLPAQKNSRPGYSPTLDLTGAPPAWTTLVRRAPAPAPAPGLSVHGVP